MAFAEDRFWNRVLKTETCWLWTGPLTSKGYGAYTYPGGQRAHRLAYESMVGPIPTDLEIDHLCRVRICVNPAHLEAVTHVENMRRADMSHAGAANAAKTHCPQGHEYNLENTYLIKRGGRACQVCNRARAHRRPARLVDDPTLAPHGRRSTYDNWGCRCEPCKEAKASSSKAFRQQAGAS